MMQVLTELSSFESRVKARGGSVLKIRANVEGVECDVHPNAAYF